MAKKKKGLGCLDYLIIILVLFVTVVCTVGYYLLILLPPILLILGFIKNTFKMFFLPKANSLKDFDLSSIDKEKLSELKEKNANFEKNLKRIEVKGTKISKRKDGLYSERSKLGKELNEQLNEIEPEYVTINKECKRLEGLPEKRKNNWLNIKSSFMASVLSIPVLIFLLSTFISKPFNFVGLTYYYITIIPKALSNLGIGLIVYFVPSIENSWLTNIYQFYPDYHAPILVSSLIAGAIYLLSKKIFFSTKERALGNIDEQNHIEAKDSIENVAPTKGEENLLKKDHEATEEVIIRDGNRKSKTSKNKNDLSINVKNNISQNNNLQILNFDQYKNILFCIVSIAAIDGEISDNEFSIIEANFINKYWQEQFGDKQKIIKEVEHELIKLFKKEPNTFIQNLEKMIKNLSTSLPSDLNPEISDIIEKIIKVDGEISHSEYNLYKNFCANLNVKFPVDLKMVQ